MSSTTVASRAYAVVPARRSRWSRGASRTSSAPAAGSARHRADAGRGAARSADAQPASCRRSFPCHCRARTAPSTRHRWRPRPDRQSLPGYVGRDVLGRSLRTNSWPRRCSSRSSSLSLICRASLEERKALASAKTASAAVPGTRGGGRRFAALARRVYVLGILSSRPSQVSLPKPPYPERRANVQEGGTPEGTGACRVGRRPRKEADGAFAGQLSPLKTHWEGECPRP